MSQPFTMFKMPFDGHAGLKGYWQAPGTVYSLRVAAALLNVDEEQVATWLEMGKLPDLSYESVKAAYELPPARCKRVVVVTGAYGSNPALETRYV